MSPETSALFADAFGAAPSPDFDQAADTATSDAPPTDGGHATAEATAGVSDADQSQEQPRLNHVLTRALGASGAGQAADAHRLEVAPGDCLLLCTDGLNKVIGDDEIVAALRESGSSAEACRRLVDLALARGPPDNVTVVVARYSAG